MEVTGALEPIEPVAPGAVVVPGDAAPASWRPLTIEDRMRVLEAVMNDGKAPASAKLQAAMKYDELLERREQATAQEDIGEELRAFLRQIRLEHGTLDA